MAKKDYEQFSTTLSIKFIKTLKLHAFKFDTTKSEILERYQTAFLRELEKEKEEKKAKKEEETEEK